MSAQRIKEHKEALRAIESALALLEDLEKKGNNIRGSVIKPIRDAARRVQERIDFLEDVDDPKVTAPFKPQEQQPGAQSPNPETPKQELKK